jgi:hypothetical protein
MIIILELLALVALPLIDNKLPIPQAKRTSFLIYHTCTRRPYMKGVDSYPKDNGLFVDTCQRGLANQNPSSCAVYPVELCF